MLAPRPSYPLFEYLAALDSIRMQPYWLTYDGAWYRDLDDLDARVTIRTRGIILVNPNNPTGSFLKNTGKRTRLCALARDRSLPLILGRSLHGLWARRRSATHALSGEPGRHASFYVERIIQVGGHAYR